MRVEAGYPADSAKGTGSCPSDEQRSARQCIIRIPLSHKGEQTCLLCAANPQRAADHTEGGFFYA